VSESGDGCRRAHGRDSARLLPIAGEAHPNNRESRTALSAGEPESRRPGADLARELAAPPAWAPAPQLSKYSRFDGGKRIESRA